VALARNGNELAGAGGGGERKQRREKK